jgi:Ran GTPase-activating protein (RanGAP) involved in mRNA processing and transport
MINISDNSIGVEGIRTMLNGLTPDTFNLIYLNLTNNDLGPECVPDLRVMLESPHLQELRLSANTLNDTSAEALSLFFYKQV